MHDIIIIMKRIMAHMKKGESTIGAIVGLAIIIAIAVIWFNNTHPSAHFNGLEDYRDTWFDKSATARVLYCGTEPSVYCDIANGNWFYAVVDWDGKDDAASSETRWIHYFTIHFHNGGWVETEATCDKAAVGWYDFERFCRAYAYDEYGNASVYLLAPFDKK